MRNLLFLALMLCITTMVYAQQPRKGAILVGGDLALNIQKEKDKDAASGVTFETNVSDFTLAPRAGFVLFDGFMVGGIINLVTYREKYGSTKFSYVAVQAGPFVRYYLPFGVFGEVNFTGGIASSKDTFSGMSTTDDQTLTSGFLGAGYAWFLNSNVSLEPLLGYGFDRWKFDNDDTLTDLGLRFRVSLVVYLRNSE